MYFFRKLVIFYLFLIVFQSQAQEWMLSEVKETAKILALGAMISVISSQVCNRGFLRSDKLIAKDANQIKAGFWDYGCNFSAMRQGILYAQTVVLFARLGNVEKLNY